jgi:hypothetical protein
MIRPNIFLILILLATFIVAPVLDIAACDDCNNVLSLQAEQELLSTAGYHAASTAQNADPEKSSPADPGNDKDLCPLCSNSAAGMHIHPYLVPVLIVQVASTPKLLAFLDPSYPITKPPQN